MKEQSVIEVKNNNNNKTSFVLMQGIKSAALHDISDVSCQGGGN